ncbi:MAG: 3'-5' exonuclease [Bdellovibrionales bacterium]|nr:3'-5' exonuclease [Bdellovibrionales bacterium]
MKLLFFDTETTGLPKNYKLPYTHLENWPHIVQLSWLVSENGQILKESDNIIKVSVPIPIESSRVHGITNEISQAKGRELNVVLTEFLTDLESSDMMVAHNLSFDLAVLQAELLREDFDPEIQKPTFCTMKSAVDYCKLPGMYGFKWPKLEELYDICFSEKLENAHNALVDVKATHRCFQKLIDDKVFRVGART